jgi:archaellum component FlaC
MAETRAKARALRDAINVGVTAFEELGGPSEEEVVESSGNAEHNGRQEARAQHEEGRGELPATRKQLNYLEALISDVVDDGIGRFEEMVGKPVGELTREEASEWIGRLSGRAA